MVAIGVTSDLHRWALMFVAANELRGISALVEAAPQLMRLFADGWGDLMFVATHLAYLPLLFAR